MSLTSFTLMRLYLRMQTQNLAMLPHIGNAGILYSRPLVDRQKDAVVNSSLATTEHPEEEGAKGLLIKKGSFGSFWFRRYSTSTSTEDIKKVEAEREKKGSKFKLQTAETNKVMLVSETGSISAVTLIDANKIARKKGLDLVHIVDRRDKPVGTDKEVYKLVSRLKPLEEDEAEAILADAETKSSGSSTKPKEVKTVLMKANIADHDALAKINQMKKWVQKGHRVRVVIGQAGDKGNSETVFKLVETHMTEVSGQIQQKIAKGQEIRFYVGPPKKTNPATDKTTKPNHNAKNSKTKDDDDSDDDAHHDDDSSDKKKNKKAQR